MSRPPAPMALTLARRPRSTGPPRGRPPVVDGGSAIVDPHRAIRRQPGHHEGGGRVQGTDRRRGPGRPLTAQDRRARPRVAAASPPARSYARASGRPESDGIERELLRLRAAGRR